MTNAKTNGLSLSSAMGASSFCAPMDLKLRPMHDAEYGGVLKSKRSSRDLKLNISNEPVKSQALWNPNNSVDVPSEDSSRCSDYSSCSDLCSSPESSTDGFHLRRTPFNSLPNHHDLLSPFAPFVRNDKSDSRKTSNNTLISRQTQTFPLPGITDSATDVVIKEDEISGLSTFEVSYKRLVIDCHKQFHEDKYFHPIREASDNAEQPPKFALVSDSSSIRHDIPHPQERIPIKTTSTSIPSQRSRDNDTNMKLDVAQSMTDLFSKDNFTTEPFKSAGVSTVAIDNKIEQAMDLVKSHLMYAVREEVEVLKEQIKELIEKNQQLEMENAYLKSNATPDLLKQLQAHVDSSPTPPPVMAAPVGSNLQSATPGNAMGFGTGQFSTQIVSSQTGGGLAAGVASSAASAASAANVSHTIGPTGNSSQSVPSSLPTNAPAPTGGGAYSSSSPSNP